MGDNDYNDDGVQYFESVVRALNAPATHHEASLELERLRSSPQAVALARSVVERSSDTAAKVQAIMLIRDALVRAWPTIPPEDRMAARNWCLSSVVEQSHRLDRPAISQLVVAVAVLWKRGWLEESEAAKDTLFRQLSDLLRGGIGSNSSTNQQQQQPNFVWQMIGVRLSLALVQEMDAVVGSRSKNDGSGTASRVPQADIEGVSRRRAVAGVYHVQRSLD
jgi:hypothetical protein